MAKIIEKKISLVIELENKEGWALFNLLEEMCPKDLDFYQAYTKCLNDLKGKLRPYFDEIPF